MIELSYLNRINVVWRKSSYSDSYGNCVEVAPVWRTSSYSGTAGNCVEVAAAPVIAIRDSKDPDGLKLAFNRRAWHSFITDVKRDQHDLG